MINLEDHRDGVILPVKVPPKSQANELRGAQGGRLKVCVTAAAENGKANAAIIELICERLSLRKRQLTLIGGATMGLKRFLVTGITRAELQARLEEALDGG